MRDRDLEPDAPSFACAWCDGGMTEGETERTPWADDSGIELAFFDSEECYDAHLTNRSEEDE